MKFKVGDKVKINIKDDNIGGRVGIITNFEKNPVKNQKIKIQFPCGTVQTINQKDLKKL